MVHEITLPFKSETCDKIKEVLLHILLISGFPVLVFGFYHLYLTGGGLYEVLIGLPTTVYGVIFTVLSIFVYRETITDWYDNHKIVFKCSCEKPKTDGVKQ